MTNKTNIRIDRIKIRREIDESPDLSWLESSIDEYGKIHSCRYTQEELDKHPRRTRRYIKEDMKRLNSYGEDWYMIGIVAEAQISYPLNNNGDRRLEWLSSGGIWGVESDSDESYLKEMEEEQLSELKEHLETFGINTSNWNEIEIDHPDES